LLTNLRHQDRLASIYRNGGRWYAAEDLLVHVVEGRKMALGADHPSLLVSMGKLASKLQETEELEL